MIGSDRLRKAWRGNMFGICWILVMTRAGSQVFAPSVVFVNQYGLRPLPSRNPVSVSSQTA